MARRAEELSAWVSEPESSSIVAVTTGDPLAVSELLDLSEQLSRRLEHGPAMVLANRLAPQSPAPAELKALAAHEALEAPMRAAIEAVAARARSERAHLARITRTLGVKPVAIQERPGSPVEAIASALTEATAR